MKLVKYKRVGNWILIAGLLLVCLYAFHDMQTAEGIGLYFSMLLGMEKRIFMDVAVDVICMVALAVMLYVPCRILGHKTPDAYLRLLIGYLAVVPQLSMAKVIALFRPGQEFVWDMGIAAAMDSCIYNIAPFLQVWLPLFLLLWGIGKVNQCLGLKTWYKRIAIGMIILLLVLLIVPTAGNVLLYLVGYLGLLVGFDCWEAVRVKMPIVRKWSVLLWALLLLRGIFRIVVLMSQF